MNWDRRIDVLVLIYVSDIYPAITQGTIGISKLSVAQSCPTLCKPVDCSLPGSSVHGILQARILEWVAMPFSK